MGAVASKLDGLHPLTVGATLLEAARRWPDNDALIIGARRATYAQLAHEVVEQARALIGLGIAKGDHVGILMPNCWDYIVLFYAVNLVGATPITLNSRYREDDLLFTIRHSDIRWLFIGGHALEFNDYRSMLLNIYPDLAEWRPPAPLALKDAPELRLIVNMGDPREQVWPMEPALAEAAEGVSPADVARRAGEVKASDICLMMFSSGTTSRPKACMLAHESLTRTGRALAERWEMTSDDRLWDSLPLFHMSTALPLTALRSVGGCFLGSNHFDAGEALEQMERERATIAYTAFPALASALVTHPTFETRDLGSLRISHIVGPANLLRRYAAYFPQAISVNSYGLTEASGVPVYSRLGDTPDQLYDTNGMPFDGMEFRITDPDTLDEKPDGEPGEIWLRGFAIFKGYYNDPKATQNTVTPEGWLRTGDLGRRLPGNRLIYEGRLKDMLKIGGENVAAIELESFLATHPAVEQVQVVGVPDDHLDEVAAAFVLLKGNAVADEAELARFCVNRIASFKIPRYIRFVTEWPMSATKVQKYKLRQDFQPHGKIDVRGLIASVREKAADVA